MKKIDSRLLIAVFILAANSLFAQVGVGTTAPNGALDITSTNDGLLIPRVALSNTATATVLTPTASELVYNTATAGNVTPGFYYWSGTAWIRLAVGANTDWSLTGNAGTTAGTNFLGTTDAIDVRIKTAGTDRWNISNANNGQLQSYSLGTAALPAYSFQTDTNTGIFSPTGDMLGLSTAGTERMRINTTGQVMVNTTAPFAGDRFSVYNTTVTDFAVNGYSTSTGVGIYGQNTAAGYGVYGLNNSTGIAVIGQNLSTGAGVLGVTAGSVSAGVFGRADVLNGSGVYGTSNGTTAIGTEGFSSGAGGTGVYGTAIGNQAAGVFGITNVANGSGVWGYNQNLSGTGVLGSGNNYSATYLTAGTGGAFTGSNGMVAYARGAAGTGVIGAGNNIVASTITQGSGGGFSGTQWGVFGNAALSGSPAIDRAAFVGNYNDNATASTVYVGGRIGGVHYKILGPGAASVSTTMPTRDGERVLFAPEAPENWFFDIGEATLVNGKATVTLDPLFADCIADSKPFKVFVQGAEETYGSIRVTRNQKDKTFTLEDMGGASNGTVQYNIYAIWKQKENLRFPKYEQHFTVQQNESVQTKKKEIQAEKKASVLQVDSRRIQSNSTSN
jgi:hypothetical protein